MKGYLTYVLTVVLAVLMSGCTQKAQSPADTAADDGFRMMIRLWPAHHNDPTLTDQLLEAFAKYDFCDEVWLCSDGPATHSVPWHEPHIKAMGVAAEKFREAGIIPSLQVVALGHGDGEIAGTETARDTTIRWGTMVGPDGAVTNTVNCPRQPDYLACMEEAFAIYAAEFHPHSLYLDDDMRITQHPPAREGCYCDDCIALFNKEYGHSFTRQTLVDALLDNQGEGKIRSEWIAFGQESLAGIARSISRGVHRVSPETRMGLQHTNFHHKLLEGWDWNPMFRVMKEETGMEPVSRPGHGFYNDHAPRGIIEKGLGIARQVRRLEPEITEIAPEIEGYLHKATGKSPRSICVETMYYLSMGATQMSYAIICGNQEPISWYADNYFKALSEYKPFAKEYASFNKGTAPAGIDPYISKDLVLRNVEPGEDPWAWTVTSAGSQAFELETLGFPFAPEAEKPGVRMLDEEVVRGTCDSELTTLLSEGGVVVDMASWNRLVERKLTEGYSQTGTKGRIRLLERGDSRLAVVPSYSSDINGTERLELLQAFDWASGNTLPAVLESFAQSAVVPRSSADGKLRSVAILNCSISDQPSYTLRLRTGDPEDAPLPSFIWKKQGQRDVVLKPRKD
ncbi:MAG: hypothetical protein IK076_01505, partial [Bacteroidales bacterium]|nr:hypothetical protein [Bacteroidales bacterium]